MMWIKIVWGLLGGNLGGIVSAITGTVTKLSDNDTARLNAAIGAERDVAIAQMQASAAAYHDRAQLMASFGWAQVLIMLAVLPPIIHEGLVFVDSMCWGLGPDGRAHGCELGIPRLPGTYEEREWLLISALLGIQTAVAGAGSFLRALHR